MVLLAVERALHFQCLFIGLVTKVGWFCMPPEAGSGLMEDFSIKIHKQDFGTHLFRLKMFSRQDYKAFSFTSYKTDFRNLEFLVICMNDYKHKLGLVSL